MPQQQTEYYVCFTLPCVDDFIRIHFRAAFTQHFITQNEISFLSKWPHSQWISFRDFQWKQLLIRHQFIKIYKDLSPATSTSHKNFHKRYTTEEKVGILLYKYPPKLTSLITTHLYISIIHITVQKLRKL